MRRLLNTQSLHERRLQKIKDKDHTKNRSIAFVKTSTSHRQSLASTPQRSTNNQRSFSIGSTHQKKKFEKILRSPSFENLQIKDTSSETSYVSYPAHKQKFLEKRNRFKKANQKVVEDPAFLNEKCNKLSPVLLPDAMKSGDKVMIENLTDEIAFLKSQNAVILEYLVEKDKKLHAYINYTNFLLDERNMLFMQLNKKKKTKIGTFCRIKSYATESGIKIIKGENSLYENIIECQKTCYNFSRIFLPENTQDDIFQEISSTMKSVTAGATITLMAYGYTGSGKTFTLFGDLEKDSEWGLIPRLGNYIFKQVELTKDLKQTLTLNCSAFEVYNEKILDLSDTENKEIKFNQYTKKKIALPNHNINTGPGSNQNASPNNGSLKSDQKGTLNNIGNNNNENSKNNTSKMDGLTVTECKNFEEFLKIIKQTMQQRTTKTTKANPKQSIYFAFQITHSDIIESGCNGSRSSSRSHFFFQMEIVSTSLATNEKQYSYVNVIDLAGMETFDDLQYETNNEKKKIMTESKNIKKSLTTLGRVLKIIKDSNAEGLKGAPFRESKLTRILQMQKKTV